MKSKPKIVFLDEGTIASKELDLSLLKKLGHYKSYFTTPKNKTVERILNADIVISNKIHLGSSELQNAKNLKLIAVPATGFNNVDLSAAQKQGIVVSNVVNYATIPTAEHAVMMIFALAHRLNENQNSVFSNKWQNSKRECFTDYSYSNLHGKILGVLGYGNIGKHVAKISKAAGMKAMIGKIPGRSYSKAAKRVALNSLLKQADFISLNCPLTPQTFHLINKERLQKVKPTAFLINTARGDVVDEKAVANALEKNQLAGYAADAFSQEPLPKKHPFLKTKIRHKVLLTPHMSWASLESRQILRDELVKNIKSFLNGKPRNRVL